MKEICDGGETICSVGDSFNIELSEDTGLCEYKCNDCGKEFKGIRMGKTLKCPECHSTNTSVKVIEV